MSVRVLTGDCRDVLATLPDESVHCVVTSPPYWGLRSYDVENQIGLESTLKEHLTVIVDIFQEVRRVLTKKGTCWLNYGDCYASSVNGRSAAATKAAGNDDRTHRDKPIDTAKGSGLRPGNLCLIPERLAIALQSDGWWVRSRIIWGKTNTKPDSSGRFRPSYNHEMIWLLTKSAKSHYDAAAVRQPCAESSKARLAQNIDSQEGSYRQPGKTNGSFKAVGDGETRLLRAYEAAEPVVWEISTASFSGAHTATFPPKLVVPCIAAGCPQGGTVLDPFAGSGTVGLVADRLGRDAILIELNPEYADMARNRITQDAPLFAEVGT